MRPHSPPPPFSTPLIRATVWHTLTTVKLTKWEKGTHSPSSYTATYGLGRPTFTPTGMNVLRWGQHGFQPMMLGLKPSSNINLWPRTQLGECWTTASMRLSELVPYPPPQSLITWPLTAFAGEELLICRPGRPPNGWSRNWEGGSQRHFAFTLTPPGLTSWDTCFRWHTLESRFGLDMGLLSHGLGWEHRLVTDIVV